MPRYIDADTALKRFEEMHGNESELLNCYNADWIVSFIETQPTADVQEVKHGRWLFGRFGSGWCSECHHCGFVRGEDDVPNYCPNCGAKMDLESKKAMRGEI